MDNSLPPSQAAISEALSEEASVVAKQQPRWWEYDPIVVSASQIDTWDLCHRKWGWNYIEGIKGSNEFAKRGTAIDEILSSWLEKGAAIDGGSEYGKIITPGIKYLPLPGTPTLQTQREFYLQTEHATYFGKKDFEYVHPITGIPVVGDHKTTVDFRWAKTEETLKTNTQAVIYAAEALDHYGVDKVELNWVYYRTRGAPASHLVKLSVLRDEMMEQMDRVDNLAREVVATYKASPASALDLPFNPGGCEAFGGCIYKERCNLTATQKMRALMSQHSQGISLMDKLKAKNAAKGAAAAAADFAVPDVPPLTTAPAPTPTSAPAVAPVSLAAQIIAQRKAQGVNPPAADTFAIEAPSTPSVNQLPAQVVAATADAAPAPARRGRGPNKPKAPSDGAIDAEDGTVSSLLATISDASASLKKFGVGVKITFDFNAS